MKRRLLKKIFAVGLAAAMAFASVPFVSGLNCTLDAEAADSTNTSEGTVSVEYTVQVNQTSSTINEIFDAINKARTSITEDASDGTTKTVSELKYNNKLEKAAIQRAEDIALFNPGNGIRPNGTSEDSLIPDGSNVVDILTYTGAYNSSPVAEWTAAGSKALDSTILSAAVGHVTYNNTEFYTIFLSTDNSTDTHIGSTENTKVEKVQADLSYNNIKNIYAAYTLDGSTYSNAIKFESGNGSSTAKMTSDISVSYKNKAVIPSIKYQVSTNTSTSGNTDEQTYDISGSTPDSIYVTDSTGSKSSNGLTVSGNTITANVIGTYNVVYEKTIANQKTLFEIPVTVTAADISGADVIPDSSNSYYANGKAAEPAVTVRLNGKELIKDTDYTVAYSNNNPANTVTTDQTATVTVTGKGNYTGTATGTFTIHPSNGGNLSAAKITVTEKNIIYDGKEKKPKITVTLQDVTVPEASYTVKYANNIKAGTANIIVTAKSGDQRYTGVAKGTFTIAKADLASADFTFSDSDNKSNTNPQYSYTGADIKPEPGIKVGSETLKKNTDFTYSYSNNKSIGTTATVTITGKGNYTGTAFAYYEITQGNLAKATITPTPSTFTYNGQKQYPAVVVVSIGTHQLVQGRDYTISAFPNSVDAGTYNFTITGINNFKGTDTPAATTGNTSSTGTTTTSTTSTSSSTGSTSSTANTGIVTGSYTIETKDAKSLYKKTNGISVSSVSSKTYTGKAITPEITVTDDALGTVLSSSTDYTRTDSNNTTPGTAQISLAFKGNYTGTINISYKILPKKTSISKVTAGKKKATVTYKKVSGITGYQIKCGTNRSVTKGTKTKTTTKTKYTMKSLKKGKRYYFKIRTYYTTSSGTKVYSSWSNVKSAKVK